MHVILNDIDLHFCTDWLYIGIYRITEIYCQILDYMISLDTSCDNLARVLSDYTNLQQVRIFQVPPTHFRIKLA